MVFKRKWFKCAVVKLRVGSFILEGLLLGVFYIVSFYVLAGVGDDKGVYEPLYLDTLLTRKELMILIDAVYYGHITKVRELINKQVSNRISLGSNNFSLLQLAVKRRHAEIAMVLIENSAEVNKSDLYGVTPLFSAILNNNILIVEMLINNGANVNKASSSGFCPLHVAALNGCATLVQILINNRAVAHSKSKDGNTPLHTAAYNLYVRDSLNPCIDGYSNSIKQLIKAGCAVDAINRNGATALHIAAMFGNTKIVNVLIEQGADINILDKANNTPLHYAVCTGISFNELISNNYLCMSNEYDMYKSMFIRHLYYCYFTFEKVSMIRQKINFISNTTSEITYSLIINGADKNKKNKIGMTPLFLAVKVGALDAVKVLVRLDADLEIPSKENITPLYMAVNLYVYGGGKEFKGDLCKYPDILKELIKHGANLNHTYEKEGDTFLHLMVEEGNIDLVETLLQCGADYTRLNNNGEYPTDMFDVLAINYTEYGNCDEVSECLAIRQDIDIYLSNLFKNIKCNNIKYMTPKSLFVISRDMLYKTYKGNIKFLNLPPGTLYPNLKHLLLMD